MKYILEYISIYKQLSIIIFMEIKNSNKKVQNNIGKIKTYFENENKKYSSDNMEFEITQFEVETRIRDFLNDTVTQIKITTNVKNPNNPFLKKSFFIILSKTGKVSRLLAHDHPSKGYADLVKRLINRGLQ